MLEMLELTCPTTWACLFTFNPGVLNKTLSHMWGKLNLPMLLFKEGLLTLTKMDSLIYLANLCPSLPIIWKLLWLVGWPIWLLWWWIDKGSFRCSFYLSPKVLEVSPMYSSLQAKLLHWYQYMAPLWLTIGSLSFGKPGDSWWCYCFWSGFECHIYHRSFWYFHKDLVCRVWQCAPYFFFH